MSYGEEGLIYRLTILTVIRGKVIKCSKKQLFKLRLISKIAIFLMVSPEPSLETFALKHSYRPTHKYHLL
jgi:hypothetical protein